MTAAGPNCGRSCGPRPRVALGPAASNHWIACGDGATADSPSHRGEPCRLKVADYNTDVETLAIREAKSGKTRHVTLTGEAPDLLEPLVAGRSSGDSIFKRDDGRAWKRAEQVRPMRGDCKRTGNSGTLTRA